MDKGGVNVNQWITTPLQKRRQFFSELFKGSNERIDALLSLVKAPAGYGVYASIGPHYQYALFARDALAVGEDLLAIRPALVREIILALAQLQGEHFNETTEEESGKMHHEYRSLSFAEEAIPETAKRVLQTLGQKWGSTHGDLLYYGAIDTTPLFVRLACNYAQRHESSFFETTFTTRAGQTQTLRQAVEKAVAWIDTKVQQSPWNLLEFKRHNPLGLLNQAWKDSNTAYLHLDASVANADNGIASIEVQGYAYDALLLAADLIAKNTAQKRHYLKQAQMLGVATITSLWMNDEQFFAVGCDRDEAGIMRQIQTRTSNAGALFNSNLLHVVPEAQRLSYIRPIVKRLMSEEFLTPVGIRCRSRDHADLVAFADYHGSLVSWPKDTYEIAKGFRKWGYDIETNELLGRLRRAFEMAGEAYEFFYVDQQGRAKYHYRQEYPDEPTFHDFGAANTPEPAQAWSISAAIGVATVFSDTATSA